MTVHNCTFLTVNSIQSSDPPCGQRDSDFQERRNDELENNRLARCTSAQHPSVVYTDNSDTTFMNAINKTVSAHNAPTLHIEPLTLWQCACGGRALPRRDFQHIIICPECETLAKEIGQALDDLEKGLGRRHRRNTDS